MSTLVFLDKYNNYFNRIIKSENSLEGYLTGRRTQTFENLNFNPNDSVTTELIINWSHEWNPDYLLVLNSQNNLESRWFVVEAQRTRAGQYMVTLKRDSVADYQNLILNAPTFVEKATVSSNDPLLFNSEGMGFNQIKKQEILLKDETQMAWLVGYAVQDAARHPSNGYYEGSSKIRTTINAGSVPSWLRNMFGTSPKFALSTDNNISIGAKFQTRSWENIYGIHAYCLVNMSNIFDGSSSIETENDNANWIEGWDLLLYANYDVGWWYNDSADLVRFVKENYPGLISSSFESGNNRVMLTQALRNNLGIESYDRYVAVKEWDGRVFKDGDRYYKIHVSDNSDTYNATDWFSGDSSSNSMHYFKEGLAVNSKEYHERGSYTLNTEMGGSRGVELTMPFKTMDVYTEEVYSGQTTEDATLLETAYIRTYIPSTRKQTLEQPYDMFCIPYGELNCGNGFVTNKDVSLIAARSLARAGSGKDMNTEVYDVQLLPYCPVRDIYAAGMINLSTLTEDVDYTYIRDQFGNAYSVVFWCRNCDFSFNIAQSITIPRRSDATEAENLKISNECDLYRLNSPNYDGSFDFSVAKNGGSVNFFNVDCTYKPFNPYIHINPDFSGLYGSDFNDARGLICKGDFSVALLTDAWAQYELQNKNYQQIFNNEITTLDSQADLARHDLYANTINDILNNNAAKTFNAAMSGAQSGGVVGGVVGGIVTGVNTTVNSLFNLGNGLYNIGENNRIVKNQLLNNFNYNLGNIKALPASLSKTSALTYNNKLFPFIEYYTATDREKNMLLNKLRFDGMTVMAIGNLGDYIRGDRTFMRGQIIRLEGISDDTHILNDIYTEIKKGVYL